MVTIVDTISSTPLRPRHPEKAHRADNASPPKPDWMREIEDASRIPKKPLGRFAAQQPAEEDR